jgi:4-hydroxy-2-oxoheptanedioate aldolase
MPDIPRLNGAIRVLEQGKPVFAAFCPPEIGLVQATLAAPLDAVVIELEHNPYDIIALRSSLQIMLDRRQIAFSGSLAPKITPLVRIPANGGEMNQFLAKQVLDAGAYGVIWPHVSTVDEARNAVAACRYPRPSTGARVDPAGLRGDGPKHAATYWGVTQQEYYARADVWPLDPTGEIIVGIMCEEMRAVKNLPRILAEVPGIGFVLVGEGDLSQELGKPRQYSDPVLLAVIGEIVEICKEYGVVCGHPHVDGNNVDALYRQGFRWLMPSMSVTFPGLDAGIRTAGRAAPAE